MNKDDIKKYNIQYAIDAMNRELNLMWQRFIFFSLFFGALLTGYVSSTSSIALPFLFSIFGILLSTILIFVVEASIFWKNHWEQKLEKFFINIGNTDKKRPSLSKLAKFSSILFLCFWFLLLIILPICVCIKIITGLLMLLIVFLLQYYFYKKL
jgi:hypothetical protein